MKLNMWNHVRTLAALGILLAGLATSGNSVQAAGTGPTLRFVSSAGYPLAVKGEGWAAHARVVFWVHASTMTEGVELKTNAAGAFAVGIKGLSMCARPAFKARDFATGHAKLLGPPLGCHSPAIVPVPQLRVLTGKQASHVVVKVYGLQPRSVTMHVGDQLYIWEPGSGAASFTPHADGAYLVLFRVGETPPRMCPQPDCAVGFYWQYTAIKVGTTLVDLSARCRSSTPPCEVPDFAIDVTILP
jgi:hypothetical protein